MDALACVFFVLRAEAAEADVSWACVKVPDDRDRAPTDFTALQETIGFGIVPAASYDDDATAAQWPTAVCLSACGLARVIVRAPTAEPEPVLATADRASVDVFAQSGAGEYTSMMMFPSSCVESLRTFPRIPLLDVHHLTAILVVACIHCICS